MKIAKPPQESANLSIENLPSIILLMAITSAKCKKIIGIITKRTGYLIIANTGIFDHETPNFGNRVPAAITMHPARQAANRMFDFFFKSDGQIMNANAGAIAPTYSDSIQFCLGRLPLSAD